MEEAHPRAKDALIRPLTRFVYTRERADLIDEVARYPELHRRLVMLGTVNVYVPHLSTSMLTRIMQGVVAADMLELDHSLAF